MVAVIADPDEMRRYESALRELLREIRARRLRLEKEIADIRSFWNDEKYRAFQKEMEGMFIEIQVFTKAGERYADFLRRKSAALDTYLSG